MKCCMPQAFRMWEYDWSSIAPLLLKSFVYVAKLSANFSSHLILSCHWIKMSTLSHCWIWASTEGCLGLLSLQKPSLVRYGQWRSLSLFFFVIFLNNIRGVPITRSPWFRKCDHTTCGFRPCRVVRNCCARCFYSSSNRWIFLEVIGSSPPRWFVLEASSSGLR